MDRYQAAEMVKFCRELNFSTRGNLKLENKVKIFRAICKCDYFVFLDLETEEIIELEQMYFTVKETDIPKRYLVVWI